MILEIAFKEFNRHKLRTFLTMLGVTIGVFLLTSISSISEGLTLYINEQISLTSGLVFVRENDIPLFMIYRSEISQDITDDIKNIEGIDRIAEILIVNSDIGRVIGVNPENKELLRGVNIDIEEGREYDANQYEVVVGKKLAEKMDYVVGDEIKIFDKNLEIVGILEETGKEQLDNSLFVDLEVLQEISKKNDKITFLLIKPIRVEDAGKIEEEINDNIDGIEASTDKSLMNNVNRTLSQLNIMTFALGGIAG
ncbi:MAG: ABC transporter permease, partial [Candidatus Aenigmatarchaeota archaeon]